MGERATPSGVTAAPTPCFCVTVRGESMPPCMLIGEVLAPPGPICPGAGFGLLPDSMLGFLKYSKMAERCSLFTDATSHITIKNAIMAVTKSA